jgi:4-amino-4-deoxy-L-arabinose transferase-like glycosyltransferase
VGLAALLIIRLGLAWITFSYPQRSITVDSVQYLQLADSIRLKGRFEATEYLEEVRTPGYPLFLAAVQAIFGEHIGPIILIQLIFTARIAWLLYHCGKLLNAERIGLAAACLFAVNPNALFWSLTVLTETYFSLLLILSFYTLILALKRMQLRWFALSGLFLGMATLTRPIGLYLIPIWTLSILLRLRQKKGFGNSLKYSATFLVAAMLLVVYWQTHNLILHGHFSLSTTTEVTFSRFIAADTLAEALHIDRDEARLMILNAEDPVAYSFQVIYQNPASFATVTIRGVARTALGTEVGTWVGILLDQPYLGSGFLTALARGDFKGVLEALTIRLQAEDGVLGMVLLAWGVAYTVTVYVLIGLGMVRVFRSPRSRTIKLHHDLILLLISALYLISVPLANGDSRFRVPAAPLLALLGGLAFLPRVQRDNKKDKRLESSPNNSS